MALLEVTNLKKIYTTRFGGNSVQALTNVNFSVEQGEFVAIMGESGSGKTTLLNILAALDQPTAGSVSLSGRNMAEIRERELAAFRRENLGFVFQEFNLLDTFSIEDNIFLPPGAGRQAVPRNGRAAPEAGVPPGHHGNPQKYPYEVSGGQKQRAAVARALITEPQICWPTSPPAHWIPRPPTACSPSSKRSTPWTGPS